MIEPGFLNIAHRGASGLAPENTLPAFEEATGAEATAVETDLRVAADGRVVLFHDATLDRTTDGTGRVDRQSLAALGELDAGSWFAPRFAGTRIPTLEELFETFAGRIDLILHIKQANRGIEKRVVDLTRQHGVAGRITVSSSKRRVLQTIQSLEPSIRTTWIVYSRDWGPWMRYVACRAAGCGARRIAPQGSTVTEKLVGFFHDRGRAVRAWGVGDDAPLARHLVRLGIDGMTFDRPDVLATILREERVTP